MRRYSISISAIVLTALLVLALGSPSTAVLPKPDGVTTVKLAQGWFDDELAWYIGTSTNNINFAQAGGLILAPKLSSAIADGAAPNVYIVKNFQQGPVFSESPSVLVNLYTGLWRVHYITWTTGVRRPITNSALADPILNPYGIPTSGITDVATNIVVDYPILIIGQLGLAQPLYKIPQMVSFDKIAKSAVLPTFNAFFTDFYTKKVTVQRVLITDSSNIYVAPRIGANFGHNLMLVGTADSMNGWLFDPLLPPVSPPGQLPILEFLPTALNWHNVNFGYSPVVKGHFLVRTGATPSSIINNPTTIGILIGTLKITQVSTSTLNIHVLGPPIQ